MGWRVPVIALAAFAVAAPSADAATDPCGAGALLPQLDPNPPSRLAISEATVGGEPHQVLAFLTSMVNVGRGPLKVTGTRERPGARMVARQIVRCRSGMRSAGRAGVMRYVRKPTHEHFHLMHLERYRLISLGAGDEVDRARKRGFCLGDTFESGVEHLANQAPERVFDTMKATSCGARRPGALTVTIGLSVGWGDSYLPFVEGQYVDLEGLPEGDYRVLNEVDPSGDLVEQDTRDNVAGTDVHVSWPEGAAGVPEFEELGSCETRATCLSGEPGIPGPVDGRGLTDYPSAVAALSR